MENFRKAILGLNSQLYFKALNYSSLEKLKDFSPDAIVIIGMGGSGQAGNILANIAEEIKIPVPIIIWKDFGLPFLPSYRKPLYIFVSFSGNTEEVIDSYNKTKTHKTIVTSGGKLKELAEQHMLPLALIPTVDIAPRQAAGYLFYGIAKIIQTVFPEIKIEEFSNLKIDCFEKQAQKIAENVVYKNALIYSTNKNSHIGYILKTSLNETSKKPAFFQTFPEMVHNEITFLEDEPLSTTAIFIMDKNDNKLNIKKMELVINVLEKNNITINKIQLEGKNGLEKTWKAIALIEWISYHIALIKKINPRETRFVDEIKRLNK